jgi:hypothetical protein
MISKPLSDSPDRSVAAASERRRSPRYGVVAIAELTDADDAKLLPGKITQISRSGCYVDSPKTFPVGTSLKVIIFRDDRTFVARASIIHVQEQMGMGVAFVDPPEDQLKILDSWLNELPPSALSGN